MKMVQSSVIVFNELTMHKVNIRLDQTSISNFCRSNYFSQRPLLTQSIIGESMGMRTISCVLDITN